jgi:murein L,D-transpeptidase YcbB/YkuD
MRYRVSVKGHRPMNYQTPIVSGEISSLILNPPWNVPSSIATRETYYQALKDSTYLRRHRYRVIRRDSVIHSTSIKWRDHDPDNLPFRFVQDPGEGNALGRIKFMFANPFNIYLHDTPKRKPFTYATRTVSHGCIRVEEPMRLMAFLLKSHGSWSTQSVQDYLNRSRSTKTVILEDKVPVYVDYVTAWVDERHVIQFRDDVYGKDGQLARAFAEHSGGAW